MDFLAELTATETELEGVVASVQGLMEEKDRQLDELGVYRRYAEVFSRYVGAFEANPSDLEPLKRATFLAWYTIVEPSCFTGVGDLGADAFHSVCKLLDQHTADLDAEFRWMLGWYFCIADFAFPDLDSCRDLRMVLESTDPQAWRSEAAAESRMPGRGLMGKYWASLFRGLRE